MATGFDCQTGGTSALGLLAARLSIAQTKTASGIPDWNSRMRIRLGNHELKTPNWKPQTENRDRMMGEQQVKTPYG